MAGGVMSSGESPQIPGHHLCARKLSPVRLFGTLWTAAHQVPLSMGFPRQEYWSGLPFPSPGDLPDPGIEPVSPASPAVAGRFFTTETHGKPTVKEVPIHFLNVSKLLDEFFLT